MEGFDNYEFFIAISDSFLFSKRKRIFESRVENRDKVLEFFKVFVGSMTTVFLMFSIEEFLNR